MHYIVDADGSRVGQFRPETDTTWHAGNYYYNETLGRHRARRHAPAIPAGYSDGLYETSRKLVKSIRTRWNVPLDRKHIVGHYQIPDGNNDRARRRRACADTLDTCETSANYGGADNHRDPGYNWQWCQYMEQLGGSCTCNDAWPLWNCTTDKTEAVRCINGKVEIDQCTGGCDVKAIGTTTSATPTVAWHRRPTPACRAIRRPMAMPARPAIPISPRRRTAVAARRPMPARAASCCSPCSRCAAAGDRLWHVPDAAGDRARYSMTTVLIGLTLAPAGYA